jgi:type II secretory pathway predicted ATPase ExeA
MYQSYWRLKQKPFESCADPQFYYPSDSHQAALLKLRYAIENRRGGALLAGASGTGKTLLARMLRDMVGPEFAPIVHLVFPQMSTSELLAYLAGQLDAGPAGDRTDASVRRIEQFLAENTDQGRHAVVLLDEAHLVERPETLEALRLLMNFEPGGKPGLTVVLVGQPAILPTLDRMPQLEERLGVKCLLRTLTAQETAAYVDHRLKSAGATAPIFDDDALATLHALSHGVARRINRLCDLALLIGFAEERSTISAGQLEAVGEELTAVAAE